VKPRQPEWSDMTWQMRNWYYFTWLSGDFNVEQHVHYLDVCSWLKGEYPVKAVGLGEHFARLRPHTLGICSIHVGKLPMMPLLGAIWLSQIW